MSFGSFALDIELVGLSVTSYEREPNSRGEASGTQSLSYPCICDGQLLFCPVTSPMTHKVAAAAPVSARCPPPNPILTIYAAPLPPLFSPSPSPHRVQNGATPRPDPALRKGPREKEVRGLALARTRAKPHSSSYVLHALDLASLRPIIGTTQGQASQSAQ